MINLEIAHYFGHIKIIIVVSYERFMGISPMQLVIILVIVTLIFGTKKLRNMGGDLGGAVKGFKKAMKDENATLTKKTSIDVIKSKPEKTDETVTNVTFHNVD